MLAGDHLQLPPTIQSVEAERKGLGKTLFERLAGLYGEEVMSMLTVQYRMHELIMNWSSKEFYDNKVAQPIHFFGSFHLDKYGIRNSVLMAFFNKIIKCQVKAHSSVAAHMLHDVEGVKSSSSTTPTLLLIDTAGQVFFLPLLFCKC